MQLSKISHVFEISWAVASNGFPCSRALRQSTCKHSAPIHHPPTPPPHPASPPLILSHLARACCFGSPLMHKASGRSRIVSRGRGGKVFQADNTPREHKNKGTLIWCCWMIARGTCRSISNEFFMVGNRTPVRCTCRGPARDQADPRRLCSGRLARKPDLRPEALSRNIEYSLFPRS